MAIEIYDYNPNRRNQIGIYFYYQYIKLHLYKSLLFGRQFITLPSDTNCFRITIKSKKNGWYERNNQVAFLNFCKSFKRIIF